VRPAKRRADSDAEAPTRRREEEPIGWRERIWIEAERGARHTVRGRCIGLQRVVMRRRDQVCPTLAEVIDHRTAEDNAFNGISADAYLVEQYQRRKGEVPVHRNDVGDVGGKGTQTGGNRLFVA